MSEQADTASFYDRNTARWIESRTDPSFYSHEINELKEYLPTTGTPILEVGPGGGNEASILAETFDYTGIDISLGLINEAKKHIPSGKFIQGSVTNIPLKDNSFGSFWAAASLLHLKKDEIGRALDELNRVSQTEAVGFISLKKGEGEEDRTGEDTRHFAYYQISEFENILNRNGFEVLRSYEKPDGREGKPPWLCFFVKKV